MLFLEFDKVWSKQKISFPLTLTLTLSPPLGEGDNPELLPLINGRDSF